MHKIYFKAYLNDGTITKIKTVESSERISNAVANILSRKYVIDENDDYIQCSNITKLQLDSIE